MSHIASTHPLSGDIYIKIASYLDFHEMFNFRLIRKMNEEETQSFGNLLKERAVLKFSDIEGIRQFQSSAHFQHMLFSLNLFHMTIIDLSYIAQFLDEASRSRCEKVVTLCFDNRSISTEYLFDLIGCFPQLQKLRLANYPTSCGRYMISHMTQQYFKSAFQNLKELDLSQRPGPLVNQNRGHLATEDLKSMALSWTLSACKSLRILNLSGADNLPESLTDLTQQLPQLPNQMAETFKNLTSLNLSNTPIRNDDFSLIIEACESLEILNLEKCENLQVNAFSDKIFWNKAETRQKFAKLTDLNLNDTRLVFGLSIDYIIETCTSLERLSLRGDTTFWHILKFPRLDGPKRCFKNLTYIDLRETNIDNEALERLKEASPKLRQIEL